MPEKLRTFSNGVIRTPMTCSRILLIIILGLLSTSGWLRVTQAVLNRDWIETLQLWPGPFYFLCSGIVWGALFLAALVLILFQIKGAGWFTIGVAIFTSGWRWLERILFLKSEPAQNSWPFEILLNLFLLLILFIMMKGFPPVAAEK